MVWERILNPVLKIRWSHQHTLRRTLPLYIERRLPEDYCSNNDLVFNESKTKQITFVCKKDELSPLSEILAVDNMSHLGVVIDDRFSWQDHLDNLCRRLSSSLYALRGVKAVSNHKATLIAYHGLFESHPRYGIAVWGSAAHTHLERVLKLQKRALRIMFGLGWQESCRGIFKENRLLTVISLYIIEAIVLASTKSLKRNEEVYNYGTRNGINYNLTAHHLSVFERKPSYAGAKFFNILPQEMKDDNPRTLKIGLTRWFSQMPFYSVKLFVNRIYKHNYKI